MATIKKSRVEQLKKYEEEYFNEFIPLREKAQRLQQLLAYADDRCDRLDSEANFLARLAVKVAHEKEDFRTKLWAAEKEIHDLKYELERRNDEHEHLKRIEKEYYSAFDILTVGRLREEIAKQNDIIDDFIEENLNLHHELILQRDCNRMAHEVVQLANESHKPGEIVECPRGMSPQDALKLHQAAINAKADAVNALNQTISLNGDWIFANGRWSPRFSGVSSTHATVI